MSFVAVLEILTSVKHCKESLCLTVILLRTFTSVIYNICSNTEFICASFHSEMWQATRWNTMDIYQAVSIPYNGQHIFLRDFVSFFDDRLGLIIAQVQRFYIHVSSIVRLIPP